MKTLFLLCALGLLLTILNQQIRFPRAEPGSLTTKTARLNTDQHIAHSHQRFLAKASANNVTRSELVVNHQGSFRQRSEAGLHTFAAIDRSIVNVSTEVRTVETKTGRPSTLSSVALPSVVVKSNPPVGIGSLVFDAETKEYKAQLGEKEAKFTFHLTNISDAPIIISTISASCSCTSVKMPAVPWTIQPHTGHELHATMNLAGKQPGIVTKTVTIYSTSGTKQLFVKSIIPAAPMTERQKNQEMARADRQAVFKNDCAKCHAEKSRGLFGAVLYKEACGICHDAEHRATFVPDLRALDHPTDSHFWKIMIAKGKPNTLMPAFSQKEGGPLTDEQIDSLVAYLETGKH